MGEWSKKIGEIGERIVDDFFSEIGWADAQKGIDIGCVKPEKHSLGKNGRKTHGVDKIFSYESKLIDEQLDIVLVSVKFSNGKYQKADFKDYFRDLAQSIECFKHSTNRNQINNSSRNVNKTKDIGVLFWLNNDKNASNDVISEIANTAFNEEFNFDSIYIVDNRRAAFTYYSIQHAKRKFPNSDITFYYPDTGQNINPLNKKNNGKIMPVQFINSSVLIFRIEKDNSNGIASLITSIDDFDKNDLKRLMGLAQQITSNWAGKVHIAFPNYDPLIHENDVLEVKQSLQNNSFTNRVVVESFIDDFRNIN